MSCPYKGKTGSRCGVSIIHVILDASKKKGRHLKDENACLPTNLKRCSYSFDAFGTS